MKTKKKSSPKMEHFFPQIQVKTKKKGLHQKWNNFFPEFKWTPTLRCTPKSNYWGGCRCRPYSNHWGGGYSQIIGKIYPPSPPRFGNPAIQSYSCIRPGLIAKIKYTDSIPNLISRLFASFSWQLALERFNKLAT